SREFSQITPYGVCHYRFWRPEDKKFKRRISNCSLEGLRNHSLIQDATLHQYEQNVQYIMSLEMTKRNRTYGERICPFNETASECAQNSIGATRLGRNWKEIRQNMKLGIVRRATKTAAIMKKYRQRIMTKKSIDDALLFGELVSAVVLASKDELTEVAKEEDNQPILGIFVNALGSAGTLLTHRFAREFLSNGEAELAERYLESLALTTKINDVIIDDLKAWLAEENRSPSWKVLKEDAENSREDGLDGNNDKEMKHHKQLKKHIAFAVVPYADQFICTNDRASQSLQKTALRLLSLVDFKFLNSSIIDRLLRIFRDTCPLPQATTDQTLATDVLLNTIPERISVGTYLLRMESLKPDNHEKWAYFYDSVAQRRLVSEKVDDYWTRMRQFRVFKANYLHRSLAASSSVIGIKFAVAVLSHSSVQRNKRNSPRIKKLTALNEASLLDSVLRISFQHTSVTVSNAFPLTYLKTYHQSLRSLIGTVHKYSNFSSSEQFIPKDGFMYITTDTEGLVEYLTESLTTDERSDLDKKSPEAAVQLSHFGTFLPPISVFDGYTELLSAIWNADGHTIDGHDTNCGFVLRLPLSASLESKLTLWSSDAITGDVVSRDRFVSDLVFETTAASSCHVCIHSQLS
uniref:Uncharacterized protein n=1 Tax=Parascaris equorum TaxID=6256 RepID=A0A914RR71_PAREQ